MNILNRLICLFKGHKLFVIRQPPGRVIGVRCVRCKGRF
jgi:hypothetical protein